MQKFIFLGLIILTQFLLANPKGYSVETIATPKDAYFHIAGLDIDKQGRVYCATRYGDVWILDKGEWIQFANLHYKYREFLIAIYHWSKSNGKQNLFLVYLLLHKHLHSASTNHQKLIHSLSVP